MRGLPCTNLSGMWRLGEPRQHLDGDPGDRAGAGEGGSCGESRGLCVCVAVGSGFR